MKKLLLILLCLPIIGFGQNLVTNGDFEQYSNLPTEGGKLMNCDGWNNVNLIPVLEEYSANKELLKVTDLLGRETKGMTNDTLFYIYDDGTVEKKIIIE